MTWVPDWCERCGSGSTCEYCLPESLSGETGKVVAVNGTEDGYALISPSGTGTVTSVAVSGSDGLEVDSGSPVTTSGTIALGVDAAGLRTHINVEDGADVTDATNVASAGAVMESDSTTALMSFVVDEDDLVSDLDTKVPTQQSVKAYVDTEVAAVGGISDGDKGDITVSGGGTTWTVDNDVVTYSKIQDVSATDKILGRSTAGAGVVEEIACTSAGRALLDDVDASAQRTTLGLAIGTNVQAYDAELASIAGLVSAADRLPYFTGSGTASLATFTAAARSIMDDASVGAIATTLGLGTGSSPQFTAVNIGHATDTTVARVSAGVISVEGVTVPTISSTSTLTNKRVTKRVGTTTSSATPTINTDNYDMYRLSAQAAAITSFTTNLSGTPTDGQTLVISITDNGTARAITWGASFEASGTVALPTTTVISTRLDVAFMWNTVTSKWRCVGTA